MENNKLLGEKNLLDRVLNFYSDNEIDILQVQLKDVEINITRELVKDIPKSVKSQASAEAKTVENCKENELKTINSPMVGVFYLSPNPDSPDYVKEGDYVEKGNVIGLIEAMKTFNEIRTDVAGVVKEIMVVDGQMIEHGQVLLKIMPQ